MPGILAVGVIAALAVSQAGCPGKGPEFSTCPRVPGCESRLAVCCDKNHVCQDEVCEGVAWTCHGAEGAFRWEREPCARDLGQPVDQRADRPNRDTRPVDGPPAPRPDSCVCVAGTTRPCGPCGSGSEKCKTDCSGYEACAGIPEGKCTPDETQSCPNNCGVRTCSQSCSFGDCSKKDAYSKPSGDLCWSDNHCGPGDGRCVECWLKCDADGNLKKDSWCATGCSGCTPLGPPCN